jgi:hypothetical protein
MEQTKNEAPKRVLARILADELDAVQGGMPAEQTYGGGSSGTQIPQTNRFTDVDSYGDADTDQL